MLDIQELKKPSRTIKK